MSLGNQDLLIRYSVGEITKNSIVFDLDGSDSVSDEPDHAVVQSREMMKREDH